MFTQTRRHTYWLVIVAIAVLAIAIPSVGLSVFLRPDLEKIPVQRLVENLAQKVAESPDDPQLQQNLARVHGMAYAQKSVELAVEKKTPDLPWFGPIPRNVPFGQLIEIDERYAEEKNLSDAELQQRKEIAREHLQQSIGHYRRVVELDPENLSAQLGLAWSLDQADEDEQAITLYRTVIERGWSKEKDKTSAGLQFQSIVREGAEYLLPHLDPAKDQAEIKSLEEKVAVVQKIRRPVTPLAVPLGAKTDFHDVYDARARVPFDADGSGYRKAWTWTGRNAGWLVFRARACDSIDSALQMFGSVSFWCFWQNGFQALAALDDDGDGILAHDELRAIAVWNDANQNGRSEVGEVRSLSELAIVQLRCGYRCDRLADQTICWNPRGMLRADGTYVPIYDLILQPVERPAATTWPFDK